VRYRREEGDEITGRFAWEYPILSFLASGWLVVVYLVYQPAFVKMINEVPDGTVLNVVGPSVFLMLAVVINALGWTCGYLSSFEKEEE
jgi:cell division protein FtsX